MKQKLVIVLCDGQVADMYTNVDDLEIEVLDFDHEITTEVLDKVKKLRPELKRV